MAKGFCVQQDRLTKGSSNSHPTLKWGKGKKKTQERPSEKPLNRHGHSPLGGDMKNNKGFKLIWKKYLKNNGRMLPNMLIHGVKVVLH